MEPIVIHIQRTPESMGFTPGTRHPIMRWDYAHDEYRQESEVEIVKVTDNHLLRVRALSPLADPESGDFYPTGTDFTAYFTGAEYRLITFIPCPQDDELAEWAEEDDE